jgi:hypothetical protein
MCLLRNGILVELGEVLGFLGWHFRMLYHFWIDTQVVWRTSRRAVDYAATNKL